MRTRAKSFSSSITVRRGARTPGVAALGSGDAGATGQPWDVTAGLRRRPRIMGRQRLRPGNGRVKPRSRTRTAGPMPAAAEDTRGPGGRAWVTVGEVAGPSSVPIWNVKIRKCRTMFAVDSGRIRIGSPGPLAFSILGKHSPGALVGFEVHVEPLTSAERGCPAVMVINWCRQRRAAPARPPRQRG